MFQWSLIHKGPWKKLDLIMGHIVMRSRQTGCCTAATSPKLLNSRSSKCPRTSARGDEVRQEAQLEVVSRCFKVFPGIQPLKFATEFQWTSRKKPGASSWSSYRSHLPLHLAIKWGSQVKVSGHPKWWGYVMKWWDTPKDSYAKQK